MKVVGSIVALVLATTITSAIAEGQSQVVERSVKSAPNKDTRIGVYINVRPDCTSGPLPTIRLVSPPASERSC